MMLFGHSTMTAVYSILANKAQLNVEHSCLPLFSYIQRHSYASRPQIQHIGEYSTAALKISLSLSNQRNIKKSAIGSSTSSVVWWRLNAITYNTCSLVYWLSLCELLNRVVCRIFFLLAPWHAVKVIT